MKAVEQTETMDTAETTELLRLPGETVELVITRHGDGWHTSRFDWEVWCCPPGSRWQLLDSGQEYDPNLALERAGEAVREAERIRTNGVEA